jgi:hypothetical protein
VVLVYEMLLFTMFADAYLILPRHANFGIIAPKLTCSLIYHLIFIHMFAAEIHYFATAWQFLGNIAPDWAGYYSVVLAYEILFLRYGGNLILHYI